MGNSRLVKSTDNKTLFVKHLIDIAVYGGGSFRFTVWNEYGKVCQSGESSLPGVLVDFGDGATGIYAAEAYIKALEHSAKLSDALIPEEWRVTA